MYNPLLHKDGFQFSPGYSRSLPRPLTPSKGARPVPRARSRSPGRPQLALVICPDYQEFSEGLSVPGSPASPKSNKFPYPPSPRLVHHSLARARGDYVLRDTSSLPCSPVLPRSLAPPLGRELSLPGSPSLPRIQVQDYERMVAGSEVGNSYSSSARPLIGRICDQLLWMDLSKGFQDLVDGNDKRVQSHEKSMTPYK